MMMTSAIALNNRPSGPPGSAADWWASQAPHSIWHKFCLFLPPEFYRDPRRNQYIALLGENFPEGHVAAPVEHTGVGFILVPT